MPASHLNLFNDTAGFVRDYPFALLTDATVNGNNEPPINAYGPANFLAARAQIRRWEGGAPAVPDWFTVDPTPVQYRWGPTVVQLKASINSVVARPAVAVPDLAKRAFTLPWATTAITKVVLSDAGNFFFTAPLTGCTVFIDENPAGGPHVYHANAGSIPNAHKDAFMQGAFLDWSGQAHNAPNVRSFVSRPLLSIDVHSVLPIAGAIEARKTGQGRQNVEWLTIGANVMGVRTGPGAWTFYQQVAGLFEYDRPTLLSRLRLGPPTHIFNKHEQLEVVSTAVV